MGKIRRNPKPLEILIYFSRGRDLGRGEGVQDPLIVIIMKKFCEEIADWILK